MQGYASGCGLPKYTFFNTQRNQKQDLYFDPKSNSYKLGVKTVVCKPKQKYVWRLTYKVFPKTELQLKSWYIPDDMYGKGVQGCSSGWTIICSKK